MRTIVIGVGNPVRADDAVGLHVARLVRSRLGAADRVDVEELWAGGLRLAEAMSGYDRAVVVDAMTTGAHPPGFVRRVPMEELGGCRSITCVHDATLPTALELWRRAGEPVPADIAIVGIETQDTDSLSESLSAPVARAVPRAVEAVFSAIAGFPGSVQ